MVLNVHYTAPQMHLKGYPGIRTRICRNRKPSVMNTNDHKSTIFLCGDVMTGRGIDQILAHPGNPLLHETYVKDARDYVLLAERKNGPIRYPVNSNYIWGTAMDDLKNADVRIINLETSITCNDQPADKSIHYRMHPQNVSCLQSVDINCCVLANNHIMDWSEAGLLETLNTLDDAGIGYAGAGRDEAEAAKPYIFSMPGKGRILVFAFGLPSSGIPSYWRATETQPGIQYLPDLSLRSAGMIGDQVRSIKVPGDIVIISLHWGGNWGYNIPEGQINFARNLIDHAGADVIHGHSSHHFKAMEVYREKLILYGCGDLINDYEGISGHKPFRGEHGLIYMLKVDHIHGKLESLQLIPTVLKRMKISIPADKDLQWTMDVLNRQCKKFGLHFSRTAENVLSLYHWKDPLN